MEKKIDNFEIKVFHPTMDEFKNFNKYIRSMEKEGAHLAGIAKVIPPKEWTPRKQSYDLDDIMDINIPDPISQKIHGRGGLYQQYNIPMKQMKVAKYKDMAESNKYKIPDYLTYEEIETKYWKNIIYHTPIYGADVPGSITDKCVKIWNINKLGTILDCINKDYGVTIEGVNTAYLYFGMWKSSFALHTEDMDLYSINYLHHGLPKTWYAVPPSHGLRLQGLAKEFFPEEAEKCSAFLRHKMTIISPSIMKKQNVPFQKMIQEKGEFIITFPLGFHWGFNHGYNIAESTNFATRRWIEYGKRTTRCHCSSDSVNINMDIFVRRLQPKRYDKWLKGLDFGYHPEDRTRFYAAPPP